MSADVHPLPSAWVPTRAEHRRIEISQSSRRIEPSIIVRDLQATHFGVWPLHQAATACFGMAEWPTDRLVPQASIEFEVRTPDAVQAAADELRAQGYELLHDSRVDREVKRSGASSPVRAW